MTDRELLEAAAKAAGVPVDDQGPRVNDADGFFYRPWNSLADDGDALRLAVKLQLCIEPWSQGCSVSVVSDEDPFGELLADERGDDLGAVTRRAITRAAAAMAKG